MKHEWKKQEKDLYGVKNQPELIHVPRQNYIMIRGEGDPNQTDFSERISTLYALAFPLKMRFKAICRDDAKKRESCNYIDYTVYPLEGIWTTANAAEPLDKNSFVYTLMIRQPDCITGKMFEEVLKVVEKKKPNSLLHEVIFDSNEDGSCIQMLHSGSYDDEPVTFSRMEAFAAENGWDRLHQFHREIYLNDARKTAPEKRKTILRFQVQSSEAKTIRREK